MDRFLVKMEDDFALEMACPTQEIGTAGELFRGEGKYVQRCPEVEYRGTVAILRFAALPEGQLERNGRQGAIETTARWFPGVTTFDDLRPVVAERFGRAAAEVEGVHMNHGDASVLLLDLAAHGWAPGDEIACLLVTSPRVDRKSVV